MAIVLTCASALGALAQPTLETLMENGPKSARINLVFLSEGYTVDELPKFTNDATAILNALLATTPFNRYRTYFNAYALAVASNESGSDHPSTGTYRDTYFDSTFDTSGIARLLTIPSAGIVRAQTLLRDHLPEYDLTAIIVNDTQYGGSGGTIPIASVNSSSAEIMIHEMGHSFADLGDEYSSAYPGYPDIEEPNTTRQTNRAALKWRNWVLASTPVPTPVSGFPGVIGLFEGAHYHATGWYRPKLDCKMRTLGTAFCSVCAEAIVLSIYRILPPLAGWAPTNLTVPATNSIVRSFSVTPLVPAQSPLAVQWFLDGAAVPGATNTTFDLSPGDLANGNHSVRGEVTDPTTLVRTDPTGLTRESVTWTVQVGIPIPTAQLVSAGVTGSGNARFVITPTSAGKVIIERSASLIPPTWSPIHTNTSPAGGFEYTDPTPLPGTGRYYRAVLDR